MQRAGVEARGDATQPDSAGPMPTRSRERRGPFGLQGRRTDGLPDSSPQKEGEAGPVLGVRDSAGAAALGTPEAHAPVIQGHPVRPGVGPKVVMPLRPVEGDPPPGAVHRPGGFARADSRHGPVESPDGRPDGPPRPTTRPEPPRPRPPSPGRGSSVGSGERGLTNSSPWGIVPWSPWVSPPGGMGFQLPSEATCVPLAYPKRDKRSGPQLGGLRRSR